MHLSLILLAVGMAFLMRYCWRSTSATWSDRWQQALSLFLLPPALILTTSVAVVSMGHHGNMLWQPVGWFGCHLALGFLALAVGALSYCTWQQWRLYRQMRGFTPISVGGHTGKLLDTPALFAAQVGFWKSELVLSQGLLRSLLPEQIEAVLTHEAAHHYYRDIFWFFWLNWLRWFTFWLPNTEALWQELLLLRELRADAWATQQVDALVLAESLLQVVRSTKCPLDAGAAFHRVENVSQLEERIEHLLTCSNEKTLQGGLSGWLLLGIAPLVTVLFHHM